MMFSMIFAAALLIEDGDRSDAYDAMLGCAAFNTIEASRAESGAAESLQAVAYDFAKTAVQFAPDRKVETANADLDKRLSEFREKLDTGDVREMAEDWTSLETACRRLYPVRDELGKDAAVKAEATR
jgi:hypothetical protein